MSEIWLRRLRNFTFLPLQTKKSSLDWITADVSSDLKNFGFNFTYFIFHCWRLNPARALHLKHVVCS